MSARKGIAATPEEEGSLIPRTRARITSLPWPFGVPSARRWTPFSFLCSRRKRLLETRIAVVAIVIGDRLGAAPKVNEILTQHGEMIVGRMGIPYKEKNLSVIALIVDGTTDELGALTGKLGRIRGVRIKTAIAT